MILDPGFGFAKRTIRSHARVSPGAGLARAGIPAGPSRKSFLKRLGDVPPHQRVWGRRRRRGRPLGAHIAFNVAEMAQVVRVADMIRG
jgi:dihydropteroate synthase